MQVTPELTATLGTVLRTIIEGLMDFFEARQRFKAQLDLEQTRFHAKRADPVNNPLKFSSSCEDALQKLFVKTPRGYMGPVESFEDVFDDLRHHQLALAVAIRTAFNAMLNEFEPAVLEERFERRTSGALFSMPASLRYWELYKERYGDMMGKEDATFEHLFSEHFAKAYKDQLDLMKAVGRSEEP